MRTTRITIEQRTRSPDLAGEIVETWSTLHTPWAAVETITGKEHSLATAGQNLAEVTAVATLRDDPLVAQVTAAMRIQYTDRAGSHTLYISAVLRPLVGPVKLLLQERPPV